MHTAHFSDSGGGGGSSYRDPLDRDPWTETPTKDPLDRDLPGQRPFPGQRPSPNGDPLEHGTRDRDPREGTSTFVSIFL